MYKVYKFSAKWCNPCKQFEPVFKNVMQRSFSDITYRDIDIDQNKELIEQFKIKSIPMVILMKDEREIQRSGKRSYLDFEKWMNEHIISNNENIEF